jgi:hypothetical protein
MISVTVSRRWRKNLIQKQKASSHKLQSAPDPTAALQQSVTDLTPEEQERVGAEMVSLGDLEDENSEIGTCIKNVEKKYDNEYTLNKDKYADKIVKELESKPGCNFTASLLKLGLKMEKQNKKK